MSLEPSLFTQAPTLWNCLEAFVIVLVVTQLIPQALLVLPVYWLFWVRGVRGVERTQSGPLRRGQLGYEISHSLLSALIYSAVIVAALACWRLGAFPKFYLQPAGKGWPYFALSIAATLVVQDLLFYPLHRLLHSRALIRLHAIHHRSKIPTPFAFNSFHPVEAIFQILFVPVAMALFPVSPAALFISVCVVSNTLSVYGHLNFAPRLPESLWRKWAWFVCISPFHDLHHARFHGNYGLYFPFWDRLFRTATKSYRKQS